MLELLMAAISVTNIRVAVLYFDNNTPDKDFELLKKGMADMLITDLTGVEGLQVVERERLESLLAEMKLQRSKYFDPKTALRLGKGMGASHAVTGAFSALGNQLRIDVRMIEVKTGKVITTDKVIGKKDQFFDLQQKLTVSFSCALQPKTCRQEEENQSETEAPVTAILRYAKALDLADGGQLEDASKEMRQVMSDAPSFAVAKTRYLEIMKRIYAARSVRKSELSDNEKRLVAKLDQVLAQKDAPPPRAIGYRILRGQIFLHRIDVLCKAIAERDAKPAAGEVTELGALAKQYRDNQLTLLAKLDALGDAPDPELDEEDVKAGQELGLGDEPGNLDFYDTIQIRRDLGSFLTTGKEPFWGTFRWSPPLAKLSKVRADSGVRVAGQAQFRDEPRPPLGLLGRELSDEGLRYFDAALAEVPKKKKDPEAVMTETIRTLDAHAQALLELGRVEEAIAKWQTILDRFPKYEDFQEIEDKIRSALGAE